MTIECSGRSCQAPDWMGPVLKLAGVYNILFGIWVIGWPGEWFRLSGMESPRYLFLWQCIGMIVGVYGIGYLVASRAPYKHWPIVLVGFLGKVFGPIGFFYMAFRGEIPWQAGWINLFNDVIWLIPFAMILWGVVRLAVGRPVNGEPLGEEVAMNSFRLSSGESLKEASKERTLAVVFLRHFGCTFTRQFLRGLEEMHARSSEEGARLVLVHMLEEGDELPYVRNEGVARIADPWCDLYRAFGLGKGGFWDLFGPQVMYRGAVAFFRGCGVGLIRGDGLQMPGAFLVKNGRILRSQIARNASDMPKVGGLFGEA